MNEPSTTANSKSRGPGVAASVGAILRYQRPNGAFIASPDFAQYSYCWLRDSSFIAYALDRAGEVGGAERFHDWCASAIDNAAPVFASAVSRQAAGEPLDLLKMPPARFGLDGVAVEDDWPNFQVDGYGSWLWALERHLEAKGATALPDHLAPAVRRTADYLARFGTSPCYDVWEENGTSVHPATLGCVSAGLRAAAAMLGEASFGDHADALQEALVEQARRDGCFSKSNHSVQVDSSLLWLCLPFGVVVADEPAFVETVRRITVELDLNGGLRRYPTDTYYGGGAWPVLTASLGWYQAAVGNLEAAKRRRDWIVEHFDSEGRLAEQFDGELRDPASYQEWFGRWGHPATDLLWSHAMYVVLSIELDRLDDGSQLATAGGANDLHP